MPQDQDVPLLLRQLLQRLAEIAAALVADLAMVVILNPDVFTGHHPPRAQVVQGRVAGDSQDPGGERHFPRLVFLDRR